MLNKGVMKKYIVLTVLSMLSLLKVGAMEQPKDSIWGYSFGYDFDKEALLKEMETIKIDVDALKNSLPDLSKFNFEFNDSIFQYYKMDTAGFSRLRNFAFADSEKLKELREMNRNFKMDTANFRMFRGMQKQGGFSYKGRSSSQTPSRVETKVFSNITKVNFEHQYGDIIVGESRSKQVELEIRYFDTDGRKAISTVSSANNMLTVKTMNVGRNSAKIDYVISVPKNTTLNIDLRFGTVKMDNYQGAFSSNLTYSNLKAGSFADNKPVIQGRYGNVTIGNVEDIAIDASYTNVTITNADRMELSGRYNNYKVDKVKDIVSQSAVSGSFKIGSIEKFNGDMKYVNMVIDNLTSSLSSNCDYSNIKINNFSTRHVNVDIGGRYSDVVLTIPVNVSASFNIDLKNGNFDVDKKHVIKYTQQSDNSKRMIKKGQIGSKKPTAVINISNSYADVKFK